MSREIKDLVQGTSTTAGTGTFTLSAVPVAGYFTFAEAHTVGATFEYVARAGNQVEIGVGTLVDATHISRTPIRSTSGDALVNFATAPTIYETVSADYLRGVDASALPVASSVLAGDQLILMRGGEAFRILATLVGGGTAPVDNAPTLSGAQATVTGPTSATGSVTTNETGGTLYYLFSTASTATAAAVKAGSNKTVTAIGAQSVNSSALTAATQYYLHFLHRDTANQDSAVLTAGPFTTQAAGTPTPTVTGVTVSPSTANVAGGATQQYSATVAGTNSPSQGVNWSCSAGSISSSGLFTAPTATSSAQTITITATAQQDGTTTGTATATVAALVATGVTLTGPTSGQASTASTAFTAALSPVGGGVAAAVTVTPSDGGAGGTFNPASVSLTTATPSATFVYTPNATTGAKTISVTNNGGLTNPASITYTVAAPAPVYTARTHDASGAQILGTNYTGIPALPPTAGTWSAATSDKSAALPLRIRVLDSSGSAPDGVTLVWGLEDPSNPGQPLPLPSNIVYGMTTLPINTIPGDALDNGSTHAHAQASHYQSWTEAAKGSYYGVFTISSLYAWIQAANVGTKKMFLHVLTSTGAHTVWTDKDNNPIAWTINP